MQKPRSEMDGAFHLQRTHSGYNHLDEKKNASTLNNRLAPVSDSCLLAESDSRPECADPASGQCHPCRHSYTHTSSTSYPVPIADTL